ncbi:MAG: hypothetical protein E6I75_29010 [Chloroflexi bacterium]|nr:MAG: hypothetical protein E6I75_29010 [Chloroflexota bacterium]
MTGRFWTVPLVGLSPLGAGPIGAVYVMLTGTTADACPRTPFALTPRTRMKSGVSKPYTSMLEVPLTGASTDVWAGSSDDAKKTSSS